MVTSRHFRIFTLVILSLVFLNTNTLYADTSLNIEVTNFTLKDINGEEHSLFDKTPVTVLFFLHPDKRYSLESIKEIALCEKDVKQKPVRCLGIFSDRHTKDEIKTFLSEVNLSMPILIDKEDLLYGSLNGKVRPTAAIIDKTQTVVSWQPFTKVNFYVRVNAWIQFALGEISKEELEKTLDPPKKEHDQEQDKKDRNLKFAEMLISKGKNEKAKEILEKLLAEYPDFVSAKELLDKIGAAK